MKYRVIANEPDGKSYSVARFDAENNDEAAQVFKGYIDDSMYKHVNLELLRIDCEEETTSISTDNSEGRLRRRLDVFMEEASIRVAQWPEWKRDMSFWDKERQGCSD